MIKMTWRIVFFCSLCLLLVTLSCSPVGYQVVDNDEKLISELQQAKPYVLGCGDAIRVTVWRHEEASADVVIAPDGKISLPLIGEITAAGLTVDELKDEFRIILMSPM